MSTTVSYKGNTIATLSNETKTLNTAGTWVEGDISITDSGGTAAISVVDTTDSHGGTIREITALDISDTTAVASDVASGKYFYTASGVKTAGTGSGGGSSNYTRTIIAAEQTVTPTSTTSDGNTYYSAQLNVSSGLESGEEYIITYNGTEYFYTCTILWGNTYLLGEINYFYGTTGLPYPFGILWGSGTTCRMACGDSTAVTVKIEKLEFVGGGSSSQTITGTFTGDNGITVQIPCSFAPDVIYIHGDLSGDVSYRGINSISIIKDNAFYMTSDTSASTTTLNALYFNSDITGYNESNSSAPHASYSNGVLTVDMVDNTSSNRFTSGITYTYKLSTLGSGTPSATAHTIYFEFSDNTNTTIIAYYDDSFISSAITATTPTTYGNKTVELAQLDGVTWYEVGDIPLNTELVDYTSVKTGYIVEDNGEIVADEAWECVTDYIPISPSMTFTFKLSNYDNVGFYDLNKNMVRVISSEFLVEEAVGNYVIGTLNSTNIPSNAAYIMIPGNSYDLQNSLSLIRTA